LCPTYKDVVLNAHGVLEEEIYQIEDVEETYLVGNCELHGSVIADHHDLATVFENHWPKMKYDNCSFAVHDNICHCGFFTVAAPLRLNRRYGFGSAVTHVTTLVEGDFESTREGLNFDYLVNDIGDCGSEWIENPKAAARQDRRKLRHASRVKDVNVKVKKRHKFFGMKPNAGDITPEDAEEHINSVISALVKSFIAYKSQNSCIVFMMFLDFIREHIPSQAYGMFAQCALDWSEKFKDATLEQVVDKAKLCMSNWKLFETGDLFPIFKELLTLCSVLVLTPSEFLPRLMEKRGAFFSYLDSIRENSTDVVSWIMKTVAAILESVKKYKDTGDVVSAFCIVTPYQQMCSTFDAAMRVYTEVYNGISRRNDVGEYFDKAVADLELLMPSLNMSGASRCSTYVSRLKVCKQKLLAKIAGKDDNIQGFALTLTGSTGCGKTHLADALIPLLLKINGFPSAKRHIVTPNLAAKHWDNVSNDTFGMRFDDPDFLKPEFMDTTNHYITKIGRVLNNAAYFFEMADIDEKGVILCQVLVAILTSNSTEYGVDYLAREPSAIHRRIQYHVDMKVRPEFCKVNSNGTASTIIEPDKVKAVFGDDVFPDIYIFNVFECQVLPSAGTKRKVSFDHPAGIHQEDKYCFAHVGWNRRCLDGGMEEIRLQDVGIKTFLSFLIDRSDKWFASQKELLLKKEKLDDIPICEECSMPEENCECYEEAIFGSDDDSDGVLEEDYVPPEPDVSDETLEDLPHGRVPSDKASSGPYRCGCCLRGYEPGGLWIYKDACSESKGVCRLCLATTRLVCTLCHRKTHQDVGMKRNPKRTLQVTKHCKCGMENESHFRPHSGTLDGTAWIAKVVDRHMLVSGAHDKLSVGLKAVVQDTMSKTTTTFVDGFRFLDGHVQDETSKFIGLVIYKLVRLIRKHNLHTFGAWVPLEYEGTKVGAYLHSMTPYSNTLRYMDRLICRFSVACSLIGWLNFNPSLFYRIVSDLWKGGTVDCGSVRPVYPWRTDFFGNEIERYENHDFVAPAQLGVVARAKNVLSITAPLLRYGRGDFGFSNGFLWCCPLVICGALRGRPISYVMGRFLDETPNLAEKVMDKFGWLRRFTLHSNTRVYKNRFLLATTMMTMFRFFGLKVALFGLLTSVSLASDRFTFTSHSFEAGDVLSRAHKLVKKDSTDAVSTFRDDVLGPFAARALVSRLCYVVADAIWSFRSYNKLTPQSNDVSIEDYASLSGMSKHYFKKEWSNSNLDPLPVRDKSTPGELVNLITKNLLFVENFGAGTGCCAWALSSKLILLPRHFVSEKRVTYEFKRKDDISGICGNARTKAKFSAKDTVVVAEDLCVVEISALGDFADLSGHFLEDTTRIPRNALMVTRDRGGKIVTNSVEGVERNDAVFSGLKRGGHMVTWKGLFYSSKGVGNCTCMSPIVSMENPSVMLGFHLGGNEAGTGCSSVHTRDDVEGFKAKMRTKLAFVDVPSSGVFQTQMYGRNTVLQGIHPNAVAAVLDPGEFKLFGSTGDVIRDNTDIIDTPIADGIYEHFSLKDRWGPPNLKGTYSPRGRKEKWLYTANQFANSKDLIPSALLDEALTDYIDGLDQFVKENPPDIGRCLTDKEIVSGIDGCDFVSPMMPNTSIGFPLTGPKSRYMESYNDDGTTRNRFTTDMFHKQADKVRESYKNRVRCYPVSKTFVKNEPTLVTKEKCRLVNGAPVHFQFVVRGHALPLAKYICDHPDFFECSVGVVPYGRRWNHMFNRLMKKGNRIIAADYKGYDMNTGSQLVLTAFSVLIRIAKLFGWHEDDIRILEGMAADIAWPVVDLNGDILMFFGGTVSGHNLTSVLNSIINSLLLRVAFFSIYPGGIVCCVKHSFRDLVALYVYGDDLIGAVSWLAFFYNNQSIAKALGKYGLVMTPFDKKGSMRRYDDIWKVEFLKRSFRMSKIGIVGPLNELSILKRLASVHKPKSPQSIYTLLPDNLESAMIEWFYHGERVYNDRRKALIAIVDKTGDVLLIAACKRPLGVSYKARMRTWRELYN